jgi:hypothetical protein
LKNLGAKLSELSPAILSAFVTARGQEWSKHAVRVVNDNHSSALMTIKIPHSASLGTCV